MNLLITGAWSAAKEYIPEIEKQGHRVVFMQNESDTLPCAPEWVEGTVCNGLFLSHDIKQFSNLRYVQPAPDLIAFRWNISRYII